MSMEKRGVIESENSPPATKQADDKNTCQKPKCCGNACGTDPLSKIAEAATPKEIKDR